MATRKLSQETVTGTLQDTDLMLLTRDPAGSPLTRAVEYVTIKNDIRAGMPLSAPVAASAADFLPYTLPSGGTVTLASMTTISGESLGVVDDMLQITVVDPTVPGPGPLGPIIIFFPFDLPGGIPADSILRLSASPGAAPTDYQYGITYGTTNAGGAGLYLTHLREAAPGPNRALNLFEFDAAAGTPATWTAPNLTYASGEDMTVHFRHVTPFVVGPNVPQFEMDIDLYTFAATPEQQRRLFNPIQATSGVFNSGGTWYGATLDIHGMFLMFGASYVGAVTLTFQLYKNY